MKHTLLLILIAAGTISSAAANTVAPRYSSGIKVQGNVINYQVFEVCLNGIVYYSMNVRDGYSLAPKITPANNSMNGAYVRCKW
jgi:hypothetical protein